MAYAFRFARPCTIDHPVPSIMKIWKLLLPERAVKMKSSGEWGDSKTNFIHSGPICNSLIHLGMFWYVLWLEGEAWPEELPWAALRRLLPFPRKCISCATCYSMFQEKCHVGWALRTDLVLLYVNIGFTIYLVEIRCPEELSTPSFSKWGLN